MLINKRTKRGRESYSKSFYFSIIISFLNYLIPSRQSQRPMVKTVVKKVDQLLSIISTLWTDKLESVGGLSL